MLLSSLIPSSSDLADELELLLPLGFVEGGALLSSAIGVALLVIAHGLLRRAEGAYWLAILALGAGIVASLVQGLDYDRAISGSDAAGLGTLSARIFPQHAAYPKSLVATLGAACVLGGYRSNSRLFLCP